MNKKSVFNVAISMMILSPFYCAISSSSSDESFIIQELKKYDSSYNECASLVVTYKRIHEHPPQSKEEAVRIALQKIRSSSIWLFGQEYSPEVDQYIQKIDLSDDINRNMIGSVSYQIMQIAMRGKDFEYIVLNSDGGIIYQQKYDHVQKKVLTLDPSRGEDYKEGYLLNSDFPHSNITFLFKWNIILKNDGVLLTEKVEDDLYRITKKSSTSTMMLEAQRIDDDWVPSEFVIDAKDAYTETTTFKNYVKQGNIMIPSLIVCDDIPKENATGTSGFIGPVRLIDTLE